MSSTVSAGGIYNQIPLNRSTEKYPLLLIKMKASSDGIGEVSWTDKKTGFSFHKSYPFYLGKTNSLKTYYLNLSVYNREHSTIDRLLFFPLSGPGTAEVREFKLVRGSFPEKLSAARQELFGPAGREPDGFNFLVIRSPRLFGRPLLLYVNCLLGILLALAALLQRKFDLRRQFLIVLLSLWVILELSSWLNNWIAFQRDRRYFGKSLEEKRAMINTGGFYGFIQFADKELPPGASFDVRAAGPYNDIRARYYLYPRLLVPGAPYLLVFNQRTDKNYRVWKKYKEGALILKHVAAD